MTTIHLITNDQMLIAVQKPKIASGDVNSVLLHVDFDTAWDEYTAKSAIFYTSQDSTKHEMLLTNNECTVPSEVLAEAGILFIGINGTTADGQAIKTSTIVKYKIAEGAKSGEVTLYPELNMYQQFLAALDEKMNPVTENIDLQLSDQTKAVSEALAAQMEAVNKTIVANGTIADSFIGKGEWGADYPNSLEVPENAKLLMFTGKQSGGGWISCNSSIDISLLTEEYQTISVGDNRAFQVKKVNNVVYWYYEGGAVDNTEYQYNKKDFTYTYLIISGISDNPQMADIIAEMKEYVEAVILGGVW